MPKSVQVIINARSGPKIRVSRHLAIARLFNESGVNARIVVASSGADVPRLATEAARGHCDVLVAAGGDGTISGVASALIGTGKPLGVIPFGTFNLFAKNRGIPLDMKSAVYTVLNGQTTTINVGEVNGHFFLSNSSMGRYSLVLRQRNKAYRRFGRSRIVAFLASGAALLRRPLLMSIRMQADNREEHISHGEFVFVCNNRHQLELYNIRGGRCLDADAFSVLVSEPIGRLQMLKLGVEMLFRRMGQAEGYQASCARELHIESRRRRLDVVVDGEIKIMNSPLHYQLRPGALQVIVPAEA